MILVSFILITAGKAKL